MAISIAPGKANLNFMGKKSVAFVFSLIFILASVGVLFSKGLNFGIDFSGGVVIELRTTDKVELSTVRKLVTLDEFGEVSLQNFGSENDILIRFQASDEDSKQQIKHIEKIKEILRANLSTEIDFRKVDFVGPQVGSELIQAGVLSLLFAFMAIMIYIWLRFEWQFGIGAIVALVHDCILTAGLYSIMGLEFNLTSVAAILTIIGYSINDSVVIYDRIRENMRKFKKMEIEELLNLSINQTLSRTILTAGSTIAALLALVLFGGDVIRGFSIAVLFGVIIGTYSSIYIAAPILIHMNVRSIGKNKSS